MRPRVVALMLVMLLMMSVVGPVTAAAPVDIVRSPFMDVADDADSAQAFALLHAAGIFEGYGDQTVGPENSLSRAEFAKVAVATLNRGTTATALASSLPTFTDVSEIPQWAYGWINAAHAMGIIQGRADGRFDPQAPVTLAEAATMMVRALGYEPSVVGPWPASHIAKAAELGLTEGVSLPTDAWMTREAMALMTQNALFTLPGDSDGDPAAGKDALIFERFDYQEEGNFSSGDYTLAERIALFGASSLTGIEGLSVERLLRNGRLVYVVAAGEKLGGRWTAYRTVSQRITVGGVVYQLAQEDGELAVELVLNEDPLSPSASELLTHFEDDLKDEWVILTQDSSGNVIRIEVYVDTFADAFLARAETEDNEDFYGSIDIESGRLSLRKKTLPGQDLPVTPDTRIWLNGERVTLAVLEDVLEDFQDEWNSVRLDEAQPVITARNYGNSPYEELLEVWVWTENLLVGEISSRGYSSDLDAPFVRIDGDTYVISEYLVDAIEFGVERTFLLDSQDRIVDILNVPTRDAMSFAILLEYSNFERNEELGMLVEANGSRHHASVFTADLVVKWADGREESLHQVSLDLLAFLPMRSSSSEGTWVKNDTDMEDTISSKLNAMLGLPVLLSENWSFSIVEDTGEEVLVGELPGMWLYDVDEAASFHAALFHSDLLIEFPDNETQILQMSETVRKYSGNYGESRATWIRLINSEEWYVKFSAKGLALSQVFPFDEHVIFYDSVKGEVITRAALADSSGQTLHVFTIDGLIGLVINNLSDR